MKKSLGKQDYYNDYVQSVEDDIKNTEQRLYELRTSRLHLIELIQTNIFPDAYVSGKGIKTPIEYLAYFIKSKDMFRTYKVNEIEITNKDGETHENNMFLMGTLVNVSKYNRAIKEAEDKIEEVRTHRMDYDTYKAILDTYDNLLVCYLLDGKIYPFGSGIGTIYLREKKRNYNKKVVDYRASLKEKARLIANGEIPFNKEDKEKTEAEGKVYNGKDWLIYRYEEFSYWLFWSKNKYVKNSIFYSFVPSKANNTGMVMEELEKEENFNLIPNLKIGFIEMIHLARRINPMQHLKYRQNRSDLKSA